MGTVTLLSLIEQFARDPPLRTTVFNLNNGEEEALCGSYLCDLCYFPFVYGY
jgi:hypothetical protein